MPAIIPFIGVNDHLIFRNPAILRLSKMSYYRNLLFCKKVEYRIKLWVVNHNEITGGVSEYHAYILINLNCYCSLLKGMLKIGNGFFLPLFATELIPFFYRESGSKSNNRWKFLHHFNRIFLLQLNTRRFIYNNGEQ